MTGLAIHDLPTTLERLMSSLRQALTRLPGPEGSALQARLDIPARDKLSMVFTGQYSSGKSTLIKALTDGGAEVQIAADVATDDVTAYDWDGAVTLIDTPGVKAGIIDHDVMAEEALAAADLVLFCVTVQLFDDAGAEHLRHVVGVLGKRDQLLVVITKANKMEGSEALRRQAVVDALGSGWLPPIVQCDADDYLRGLQQTDSERAEQYIALSGIPALRHAINRLSEDRGEIARLLMPFQVVKSVALDARASLMADPTEQAALKVLARYRTALTTRRTQIFTRFETIETAFRQEAVATAEQFAIEIEALDQETDDSTRQEGVEKAHRALVEQLRDRASRMQTDLADALQEQLGDLAVETAEIGHGPYSQQLIAVETPADPGKEPDVVQDVRVDSDRQAEAHMPDWLGRLGPQLRDFQAFWGAGDGVRASAGTTGHSIVYKSAKVLSVKVKPWAAVKIADKIGKVAKIGAVAIPLVLAAGQVALEEKVRVAAEKKRWERRRQLIREVTRQAEAFSRQQVAEVRNCVDTVFDNAIADLDRSFDEIVGTQQDRSELQRTLDEIVGECDRMSAAGVALGDSWRS